GISNRSIHFLVTVCGNSRAFAGLGVRSLPFRVGQHIVCIDSGRKPAVNTNSWSGALPPSFRNERSVIA
ncbi:MAG: hypothetical protein QME45_10610, partial [Clostridiales bacterium]|nr:hypothetical protein [Clostridiales bacterium]